MNIIATIGLGLFAGIGFGCVIGRCCYMNRSVERQIRQRIVETLMDNDEATCNWAELRANPADIIHEDYDEDVA